MAASASSGSAPLNPIAEALLRGGVAKPDPAAQQAAPCSVLDSDEDVAPLSAMKVCTPRPPELQETPAKRAKTRGKQPSEKCNPIYTPSPASSRM
eukprot:1009025-Pyramimonas_sp.AAC.1